jgi:phosphatidylserine decarboxylase
MVAVPKAGAAAGIHSRPYRGGQPVVLFRLQVLGCKELAKDKNGFSDPLSHPLFPLSYPPTDRLVRFVVVSLLSTCFQTPVLKRCTNPICAPKDATFDFPIYLSLADKLGVVELVVWDKDMLTKEYLGEVALLLDDWFRGEEGSALGFDDPANQVG